MIKKVTKQKVVEYQEHDIFCDLCEAVVPVGGAMVTIVPQIVDANGQSTSSSTHIQVCSVDCLTKNVGAAGLVLNTKVFPELRSELQQKPKQRSYDYDTMAKEMANERYVIKKVPGAYVQADAKAVDDLNLWKSLGTR